MKTVHVTSSNIKSVRYYPKKMTLRVNFHHGGSYAYNPVTEEAYHEMLKADSVTKYFNQHIKSNDMIDCQKMKI